MSPSRRPCDSASRGLTHAVGSHVILVSGLGSSCSQPLFANRPSQIVGSGRKMISRPPLSDVRGPRSEVGGAGFDVGGAAAATAGLRSSDVGLRTSDVGPRTPVPVTNPSCSTCFQKLSALLNGCPVGSVMVQLPACPPCARDQ